MNSPPASVPPASWATLTWFLSDWVETFETWSGSHPRVCVCTPTGDLRRVECRNLEMGFQCETFQIVLADLDDSTVFPVTNLVQWQQWFHEFLALVWKVETGGLFCSELAEWKTNAEKWATADPATIAHLVEHRWNDINLGRPVRWAKIGIR